MKSIGFLGCGKIGQFMLKDVLDDNLADVRFIQDIVLSDREGIKVVEKVSETELEETDLVIESAMATVLKENFDRIIKHCDVMVFSVTAFADEDFYSRALTQAKKYRHKIYIPHGAVLGMDGIADGRDVLYSIQIETVKNPASLGREDTVRTVLYEGDCRGACAAYPRNVNVHATIALAGLGFDRTKSRIISDPAVSTNSHYINVEGDGIRFSLEVSSFAEGGITGKYTPYSAVGSLRRVLENNSGISIV